MSSDVMYEGYKNKLKGRLYGVLCEKEKDGDLSQKRQDERKNESIKEKIYEKIYKR